MEISVFWDIRFLLLWDLFLKYENCKKDAGARGCKSRALNFSVLLTVLVLLLFLYFLELQFVRKGEKYLPKSSQKR